ncbi:MFS-type transporter SLC18B1-like [Centruroides sculpturatus]|uniref:MFS-type transporter SLC18B1-like n=1 Tax=Centruroides sculpturatus TaxID=218467 RepID=UPI000C6E17EA|nr:MFS-type transporter SLC18B1-like [Centruroides sculpturatus]
MAIESDSTVTSNHNQTACNVETTCDMKSTYNQKLPERFENNNCVCCLQKSAEHIRNSYESITPRSERKEKLTSSWKRASSVHRCPLYHSERIDRRRISEEEDDDDDEEKSEKHEKGKKSSTKFTGLQKLIILCLCLVNFTSFLSMSIIAPFFPKEAEMKGMRESVSGIIFSVYALVLMVMSPIFGKLVSKIIFLLSNELTYLHLYLLFNYYLKFLDKLTDLTLFTVFCFIVRIFEAVGAAAFTTASCTYVFSMFPDDIGTVFGIIETSIGIGMSLGPAIGGSLYALGGYGLPFFILGSVVVINIPISWLLLRNISSMPNDETSTTTYLQLLSIPKVWIVCVILMVAAQTQGFLDPTLEPHMRQDFEDRNSFDMWSACYAITWFLDAPPVSPPTAEGLNDICEMISINECLAAVTALGISFAFAFIPSFECILLAAIEKGLGDNLVTYSKVSGLWNSVYSLGEVIGPALGGILMDFFGFSQSAVILSACCAIAILATFPLLCLKTPNHHKEVNEKTPLLRDNYSI